MVSVLADRIHRSNLPLNDELSFSQLEALLKEKEPTCPFASIDGKLRKDGADIECLDSFIEQFRRAELFQSELSLMETLHLQKTICGFVS